jgi:alkanesulfonate monooxygenase SsuD/methylene tetrahydromethanopterin reductase-like flavin-dependent oxidoreductase (luciferase family)
LPKPQQSPHPPLFLVGWCDAQARTAGRSGLGFFDVSGGDDATLEMHRDGYLATRAEVAAEDLVCHSAYAAAFEYAGEEACRARLEAFEQIGVDEAVLRAVGDAGFGLEGDDAWRSLESRIRLLAGESPELH